MLAASAGGVAVGLVVGQQHAVGQHRQPVHQPADHRRPPTTPGQRLLRPAARAEQRRQRRMVQHRHHLRARASRHLRRARPARAGQLGPGRGRPLRRRQRGQMLQQRVDQLAAPERAAAPPRGERRGGARHRAEHAPVRPARRQRLRRRRLGRRRRGPPAGRAPAQAGSAPPRPPAARGRAPARAACGARVRSSRSPQSAPSGTAAAPSAGEAALRTSLYQLASGTGRVRSASRRPPAGPRRGSAPHRAAGCIPPACAAAACAQTRSAAAQRSSLRGAQSGTSSPSPGRRAQSSASVVRRQRRRVRQDHQRRLQAPWRRAPS